MFRRYWPAILIAIVVSFVIVGPILSSENFGYCENHDGQYPSDKTKNNNPPTISVVDTKPNWVLATCLSGFANDNGVGITALATVLLTVVTGWLAWLSWLQISTGHKQIRAYVFPENAGLMDGTMLTPPQPSNANVPGIVMWFKNSGQSPAKDVISVAIIDIIEPRHETTLTVPKLQKQFSLSLGASSQFPKSFAYNRALNAQEIADVKSGFKRIYLFGRLEYLDIFGNHHFTNFRFWYSGDFPNHAGMNFLTSENGNDFG